MTKKRVVVTGLGMVTPLGNDVSSTWSALLNGQSGVRHLDHFDTTGLTTTFAASVKNFPTEDYFLAKEARKLDLFIQYGVASAIQAMADSGLEVTPSKAARYGVAVGSGIGGLSFLDMSSQTLANKGARKISPFFIPSTIANMVAGHISMRTNFKGPNISIVTACTTGTHNVGYASRMIQYGDADVVLCGGAEHAVMPLGISGFAATRALSKRNDAPEQASRPWDKDRDGFVMGDGAGVMVLESLEHAQARGAKIYAEVSGFGMSADAYHITQPDPSGDGFIRVLNATLQDGGINVDQVDYINAHATSTPILDPLEAASIKQVFGHYAQKLAISSTKSMTGHLLGAAGAIEAIFSVKAIDDQVVPPTINLDNPEDGCEDLNLVPHVAQEREVNCVLSNSFGFGGTNASIIFKRFVD